MNRIARMGSTRQTAMANDGPPPRVDRGRAVLRRVVLRLDCVMFLGVWLVLLNRLRRGLDKP